VAPGGSQSSYSVDGAPKTPSIVAKTGHPVFQQLFFRSPTLQDGEHTLSITPQTNNNNPFFVDYLEYTPSPTAITNAGFAPSADGTADEPTPSIAGSSNNNTSDNDHGSYQKHGNNNGGFHNGNSQNGISGGKQEIF
jgi:hypothetical protein